MKQKVFYYNDELNDDFANININPIEIDNNYKYINKNPLWLVAKFFVYRIIMTPFAYIYLKHKFHLKIINKKILKKEKKGYFLYGNHTQIPGDAFILNLISWPRNNYVIVHPDNVSVKGTRQLMMMLGALPIPSKIDGIKNFTNAINERVNNNCLTIFPEAHIWPYYTKIRNFKSVSFKYPLKFNKNTYCFTTVYQKKKFGKRPKMKVYVDGPFFPNKNLTLKEQQDELRNMVYEKMVERSKESNYEYVKYIKE